ncbi:MAG TPA: hypothetical protein VJ989_00715 [Solirubrobacterales bacterium]|nr:hypothetical protein [Solirubrobacterales bacterium]
MSQPVNRDEPVAEFFDPAHHPRVAATYGSGVAPIDAESVRALLESIIAAFAVLGGTMAYFSGFEAFAAVLRNSSPAIVAERINQGMGVGFGVGVPAAVIALMIMGWTQ